MVIEVQRHSLKGHSLSTSLTFLPQNSSIRESPSILVEEFW